MRRGQGVNGDAFRKRTHMPRRTLTPQIRDPWQLVWGQPYIDGDTLAAALEGYLQRNPHPDYRTRLLIRDAARAIRSFWGVKKFRRWLAASPTGERIRA